MFLRLFLNRYITTINTRTHNYNTRFVKDINITLPKLRTGFCQSGPYFVLNIKFVFMTLIILYN